MIQWPSYLPGVCQVLREAIYVSEMGMISPTLQVGTLDSGNATWSVSSPPGRGRTHQNTEICTFRRSSAPPLEPNARLRHPVTWAMNGMWPGSVLAAACSAPAFPSGFQPDLLPRPGSPWVSNGPLCSASSCIWEQCSSGIGGGWILWKCDPIHFSSRQLDSLES